MEDITATQAEASGFGLVSTIYIAAVDVGIWIIEALDGQERLN